MLAQKCTGAFIICHNMSIKGARKRPDMRILCRIARESEASRNPLESLQRRTEAGGGLREGAKRAAIRRNHYREGPKQAGFCGLISRIPLYEPKTLIWTQILIHFAVHIRFRRNCRSEDRQQIRFTGVPEIPS